MNLLQIGIIVFCFLETLNIIILYFKPTFKHGNSVNVFDDYDESMKDETKKDFVSYLVNWVAGTKLIFVLLGIVIVIFGNYNTQLYAVVAYLLAILTFYWRLYPLIKKLDKAGKITPKGYSKTLAINILVFIVGFIVILLIELL